MLDTLFLLTTDKSVPTALNLSAKPNKKRLEIRSRTPSPAPGNLPPQVLSTPGGNPLLSTPTSTPVSTPSGAASVVKMRKKDVNALEEFAKVNGAGGGSGKNLINLVVVGHVDSGKSTLMGHLLFKLGCVSSRVMHKYEQDSRKVSWTLCCISAWQRGAAGEAQWLDWECC